MTPLVRNFLTGTQVVVPIGHIVPVHPELVVVPVRVRDVAVRIARATLLFVFVRITDKPHWTFLCCHTAKYA
jgi:hypothetical protein